MRRLVRATVVAALCLYPYVVQVYSYLGFEQLTVANTSGGVAFTAAKITPPGKPQATMAVCRLETAQLRFTIDTTAPTTTVGTLWEIGEEREFNGHDVLLNFRAIRTGAVSGVLDCNYSAP